MNKAIKRAWLKALRSGEYEQRRGVLCRDDKYCCLGVLYDIAVDDYWYFNHGDWLTGDGRKGTLDAYLPMLGMDIGDQTQLIQMNDDAGKSFAEIADHIEANL